MSRIRLNQEYRNKIANRMRVHIEQEDTQEKEKFFQERENGEAEHYYFNTITREQRPLTEAQYNDSNYTLNIS